jgi:hypothetical protein
MKPRLNPRLKSGPKAAIQKETSSPIPQNSTLLTTEPASAALCASETELVKALAIAFMAISWVR